MSQYHAIGLSAHHFQRARRRWAIIIIVVIVTQREMLRIIPQPRHGIAVKIPHHLSRGTKSACTTRRRRTSIFGEQIGQTMIIRLLLCRIGVILIRRIRLRRIKPEWVGSACSIRGIDKVRVGRQQRTSEVIGHWRAGRGGKRRFPSRIGCRWIRTIVMIK